MNTDTDLLIRIVNHYGPGLYDYACRLVCELDLTSDLKGELLQHTWTRLYETSLHSQNLLPLMDQGSTGQKQLGKWLSKVIYNKAIDCWRAQQHLVSWEEVEEKEERKRWNNEHFEDIDAHLLQEDRNALLELMMQQYLSERQLSIIKLLYFDELTIKAVSEQLDMPGNTIKSHQRRAILALRSAFKKENILQEDMVA